MHGTRFIAVLATLSLASACSGSDETAGAGGTASTLGSGGGFATSSGAGADGIPANFTPADQGAYALGAPVTNAGVQDTGVNPDSGCNILVGVVRDFKGANEPGGHPDFEAYLGSAETTGLVQAMLGTDLKPVYGAHCDGATTDGSCPYGQMMTNQMAFDEWYRYTADVNRPYLIYFKFAQSGAISTFDSSNFFPLDGTGWGNSGTGDDGQEHNFHFTTELHTKFKYTGGEVFTFTGDDDLWVFINNRLAIDLGGVHPAVSSTITLDQSAGALGITAGSVYPLDLFHAERHTTASHFRVDTDLAFVDCGTIPPDPK